MKKRPPGWKGKKRNKEQLVISYEGEAASKAWGELVERMKNGPASFVFGSNLPHLQGADYMCMACTMPTKNQHISECCGAPVVQVMD